jgi:hypothetical protein
LFCGSGAAAPAAIVVGDYELAAATVRYGVNAIGSTIEGSAFSGLFTHVEIGHWYQVSREGSHQFSQMPAGASSMPDRRLFESRNRARRSDRANNSML